MQPTPAEIARAMETPTSLPEGWRCNMVFGEMKFIPPKYWIEPVLDLRGRPISWSLMCDAGCNLLGFETHVQALSTALSAGIVPGRKPETH